MKKEKHPGCYLFKTHEIYKSRINYSIAYPKPQNKRVFYSLFVSLEPSKKQNTACLKVLE